MRFFWHKRRDAVLTLQQAEAETANPTLAQDLAIEANKRSPDLVPAAVMAAQALTARGKRSAAAIRELQKLHPYENLYNLEGGILAWAREIDPEMKQY